MRVTQQRGYQYIPDAFSFISLGERIEVLAAVAEQHFHTVLGTLRQQYQKPLNLN